MGIHIKMGRLMDGIYGVRCHRTYTMLLKDRLRHSKVDGERGEGGYRGNMVFS
jgi:hypothetical protein